MQHEVDEKKQDEATIFKVPVGSISSNIAAIKLNEEGEEDPSTTSASSDYTESTEAKKSVSEILSSDAADESLRKYKESLLGSAVTGDLGDPNDPRRVIVTEFRIIFEPSEGQADVVFNLDTPIGLEHLKKGLTIKEGAKYKFKLSFKVQHDIVSGIKFVNKIKKVMFSDTDELVIGSYPPSSTPHIFEFPRFNYIEAPSGMMYRGTYTVKNKFISSDKVTHLEYSYELRVTKTW